MLACNYDNASNDNQQGKAGADNLSIVELCYTRVWATQDGLPNIIKVSSDSCANVSTCRLDVLIGHVENSLQLQCWNVWEWCFDSYGEAYYADSPPVNPTGPGTGPYRVLRGGSWLSSGTYCRSAKRFRDYPEDKSYNIGFRVVRRP